MHVLSYCPVSLRQGRSTCRHDGIVRFIATSTNQNKYKVYEDIEGFRTNADGTIPPEVLISTDKPDLVIIDEENKKVNTFELTVPHISNIEKRHESKSNKYKYLESETKDYAVQT